jgi:hypothetical protein
MNGGIRAISDLWRLLIMSRGSRRLILEGPEIKFATNLANQQLGYEIDYIWTPILQSIIAALKKRKMKLHDTTAVGNKTEDRACIKKVVFVLVKPIGVKASLSSP